jgi:hypothetical protein
MAAKREDKDALVPSRQVVLRQADDGRDNARFLTVTGWWSGPRRRRVGLRPLPLHGLGGKAALPGAQTLVPVLIPTA